MTPNVTKSIALAKGDYTFTVSDANGCSVTKSVEVTQYPEITIDYSVTGVTCTGSSNGSIDITVNGGSGDYTYSWGRYTLKSDGTYSQVSGADALSETSEDINYIPGCRYVTTGGTETREDFYYA